MTTPTPELAARILQDISDIRELIDKRTSLYRRIYSMKNYRAGALAVGIWFIVIALLIQVLLMKYGGYRAIPVSVRTVGILGALLGAVLVKWVQIRGAIRAGAGYRTGVPPFRVLGEALHSRVYLTILPVAVVMVVAAIRFAPVIDGRYWMPITAVGMGIIYNIIALATRLTEHHLFGYWLVASGLVTLTIGAIEPHVVMACSFGLGSLMYAAFAYVIGRKRSDAGE